MSLENSEVSSHSQSPTARVSRAGVTTRARRPKMSKSKTTEPNKKTKRKGKNMYYHQSLSVTNPPKRIQTQSAPVTMAPPFVDTIKPPQVKKLKTLSRTSSESSGQTTSSMLFQEEDKLVKAHRHHIDEYMVLIKQDMQLLKNFEHSLTVNLEEYVRELKELLHKKMKSTDQIWKTLTSFRDCQGRAI